MPSMHSKDRQHRDLEWALHSTPLVGEGTPAFIWPSSTWFANLPSLPRSLNLPAPKYPNHFRLGHHFERLLEYWLNHQRYFDLIAANLQINQDKRTLGEFDFLVKHKEKVAHWETAIKFYLIFGDNENPFHWFGPNPKDSLGDKYTHLINHQLTLSEHPDSIKLLSEMSIEVDSALCFMKGRLFYPFEQFFLEEFVHPSIVNPNHEKGWWLTTSAFTLHFDNTRQYKLLEKSYWLAPLEKDIKGESLDSISKRITGPKAQTASLIAVLDDDDKELSRGFVVNENWINLASSKSLHRDKLQR